MYLKPAFEETSMFRMNNKYLDRDNELFDPYVFGVIENPNISPPDQQIRQQVQSQVAEVRKVVPQIEPTPSQSKVRSFFSLFCCISKNEIARATSEGNLDRAVVSTP